MEKIQQQQQDNKNQFLQLVQQEYIEEIVKKRTRITSSSKNKTAIYNQVLK